MVEILWIGKYYGKTNWGKNYRKLYPTFSNNFALYYPSWEHTLYGKLLILFFELVIKTPNKVVGELYNFGFLNFEVREIEKAFYQTNVLQYTSRLLELFDNDAIIPVEQLKLKEEYTYIHT